MLELTLRLVASLAVVVGLMLLLARLGARRFKGGPGAVLSIAHRQALSRGSSIAVVTVGSRILVVGATDQHVSLLAELDSDELDVASYDLTDVLVDADAAEPQVLQAPSRPLSAVPGRRIAARPAPGHQPQGALAGSLLSTQTWRQALAVATGRRAS